MPELSKKEHEKRFKIAICEVIEAITDHKNIDITDYRIDSDDIITVEFDEDKEEKMEFIDLAYVDFVMKKKAKDIEKQLKGISE